MVIGGPMPLLSVPRAPPRYSKRTWKIRIKRTELALEREFTE
jgi:hypothetical protein